MKCVFNTDTIRQDYIQSSNNPTRAEGGFPKISYILSMCRQKRVWFLSHFGLKTGIDFDHYGLKLGMVFKGAAGVYKRVHFFNSKK